MRRSYSFLLILAIVAMLLAVPAFASAVPSGETGAVSAVVPDPSVESAIAAAEAAKAAEAAAAISAADDSAEPADTGSSASDADASGEASGDTSGEASGGLSLSVGTGELINVLSSAIVLPLCFLSIILWFFRAYGQAHENKDNIWLKIYKVLRKIHIPVGAATILIGGYHAVFASIKHGFSLNWGSAAMSFFLLGFLSWVFRKRLKRRWLVLHRFTALIATICMMIHAAPYLEIVFTGIVPMMLRQLFA